MIQKKDKIFDKCLLNVILNNLVDNFNWGILQLSILVLLYSLKVIQHFLGLFLVIRLAHVYDAESSKENQFVNIYGQAQLWNLPEKKKKSLNN